MEPVKASLVIRVWAECPHCTVDIDLMDPETTKHDHNEEGGVIRQACPRGNWSEEHRKFSVENVQCANCNGWFDVKEIEW